MSETKDLIYKAEELKTLYTSASVNEDIAASIPMYIQILDEIMEPTQYDSMLRSNYMLRVKSYEDAKSFYDTYVAIDVPVEPEQAEESSKQTPLPNYPENSTKPQDSHKVETGVASHPIGYLSVAMIAVTGIVILTKDID